MERAWKTLERIGVTCARLSAPSANLSPSTLELIEEFDWMHDHEDGGLLTVCMHPQVIGRGHRMAMLGRFVDHCRDAGATFARMGDVARALDGRSET